MPPKPRRNTGKGAAAAAAADKPSEIFEIDVAEIPKANRAIVDFNKPYSKYYLICAIFGIRTLSHIEGTMFGPKHVVLDKKKGYQDLFLITFINGEVKTEIIISLSDIYLYGVLCNGKWFFTRNDYYSIKGGILSPFKETYPVDKKFMVGIGVVKNCVDILGNADPSNWQNAYLDLAINIAESVRFDAILREFISCIRANVLTGKLRSVLNEWTNLSKLCKIFFVCNIWNPQKHPCDMADEEEAYLFLAIVKDQIITDNEMTPKKDEDKKEEDKE